jgi:hypothetical protein
MNIMPSYQINENTSPTLRFAVADPDGGVNLIISAVHVYLFVQGSGDPPVYINGRDGTYDDGLTFTDNGDGSWLVTFHMSSADNAIIDGSLYVQSGFERHRAIFEIDYGVDDIFYQEVELCVKDLPIVTES